MNLASKRRRGKLMLIVTLIKPSRMMKRTKMTIKKFIGIKTYKETYLSLSESFLKVVHGQTTCLLFVNKYIELSNY
jgi:hypothetical protein